MLRFVAVFTVVIASVSAKELKSVPEENARFVADEIARRDAEKWNPTNTELMSMLQTLAGSDSEFRSNNGSREDQFYCALRLTLAVERLSSALGISEKINKESSSLRGDVQRHYDFDSAASPNICEPYGRNCSELLRVQLEVDLHVVVIALAESVRQRLDLRYATGDRLD